MTREVLGKYTCVKCGTFCGLVTTDALPEPPPCPDPECPAKAALGRKPRMTEPLPTLEDLQAMKLRIPGGASVEDFVRDLRGEE